MNEVVVTVQQRQAELRLSNSALARKLGIDRATWILVSQGKREPSVRLLKNICKVFPDLQITVFKYITD